MHVPFLSIVFMGVSAVLSIGVPFILFFIFRKKFNAKVLPAIFGIAGFIVFVLVLEALVHRIVLGKFGLKETPVFYIIYAVLMAGIFEETARFIAFKILRRKYNSVGKGLSYGTGHGGIESILLAGVPMLAVITISVLVNTGNLSIITGRFQEVEALKVINNQIYTLLSTVPYMFLFSGIERMMAIAIQLSLSIVVFYAVYGRNKTWLYPLAIIFHGIIDIPAAAMQAGILNNVFLVEGIILLLTIAIVIFAKYLHGKFCILLLPLPPSPFAG